MIKKFLGVILLSTTLSAQGSLPNQLRVVTDANGYLVVSGAAQTLPLNQPTTFTNTRLQTDANGYLVVTIASGTIPFTLSGSGLGTTSTDGLILVNTTTATAGVPVQISPRILLRGNAWNGSASVPVDVIIENLPSASATPNGLLRFGFRTNNGAITYGADIDTTGNFRTLTGGTANLGGNLVINAELFGSSATRVYFGSNGQLLLRNFAATTGVNLDFATDDTLKVLKRASASGAEFNLGVPTLGTCTGGSLTSGSHNFGGEVTGTTGGSCVINFGTPNFTNTPFCTVGDGTAGGTVNVTVNSASSITVANITSGHTIRWNCLGRIGT